MPETSLELMGTIRNNIINNSDSEGGFDLYEIYMIAFKHGYETALKEWGHNCPSEIFQYPYLSGMKYKIPAIKMIRKCTHLSLKESKELVERLAEENPWATLKDEDGKIYQFKEFASKKVQF